MKSCKSLNTLVFKDTPNIKLGFGLYKLLQSIGTQIKCFELTETGLYIE